MSQLDRPTPANCIKIKGTPIGTGRAESQLEELPSQWATVESELSEIELEVDLDSQRFRRISQIPTNNNQGPNFSTPPERFVWENIGTTEIQSIDERSGVLRWSVDSISQQFGEQHFRYVAPSSEIFIARSPTSDSGFWLVDMLCREGSEERGVLRRRGCISADMERPGNDPFRDKARSG
ncbi:hypothetical protein [Burkholderia ubonensis]|uniref:hypothetical protein n=1 Tax=Burkholderia ubonensis TaxID=101571 RepID=UPI0012F8D757|nr:hypothetical protein [Burkholderia ubonensis]